MYDAGELSTIMVSPIGRPSCDRSWDTRGNQPNVLVSVETEYSDLHVVSSVVITTFSEQPMGNSPLWVESIEDGVRVLRWQKDNKLASISLTHGGNPRLTLLRLAVKTTTSYNSPILFKKLSTPGRLRT